MSAADSGEAPTGRPPTSEEAESLAPNRRSLRRRLRWPLMIGIVLIALVVGVLVYLAGGRIESTDDAYVKTARVTISSNISGRVIEVDVRDNQPVKAGQVLFKLDGRPAQTAYLEAEANLAAARLEIEGLKATYRQRQADVKAAEATLTYQRGELKRQHDLLASGVTSGAQVAQTANAVQQAEQTLAAARQQLANALAALGGNPNVVPATHPTVMQARARLEAAGLNQSYITVRAPQDGIVTKVDQLQRGDYITAAQPLFSLIADHVWIEANFKENQLTHMRPGQAATVTVDAFPDATLRARVDSLSPGTGSSFSLLPAENATGNWVKVVQRLPVRLTLLDKPAMPLQAGMSVTAKVDTLHKRTLPLFGGGTAR